MSIDIEKIAEVLKFVKDKLGDHDKDSVEKEIDQLRDIVHGNIWKHKRLCGNHIFSDIYYLHF